MAWRLADSLVRLRDQVNTAYPNRSKVSDGTIGDSAHAGTKSEHNPNAAGVVTAIDITHDPANGMDGQKLADSLIASGDKRVWYIIFNGRIWEQYYGWSVYRGSNKHDHHIHISTSQAPAMYDNKADWQIGNKKEEVMNDGTVHNLYLSGWQRRATAEELKRWVGRPMQEFFYEGGKNQYEWLWSEIRKRDQAIEDAQNTSGYKKLDKEVFVKE